jgi:hypothetical protein
LGVFISTTFFYYIIHIGDLNHTNLHGKNFRRRDKGGKGEPGDKIHISQIIFPCLFLLQLSPAQTQLHILVSQKYRHQVNHSFLPGQIKPIYRRARAILVSIPGADFYSSTSLRQPPSNNLSRQSANLRRQLSAGKLLPPASLVPYLGILLFYISPSTSHLLHPIFYVSSSPSHHLHLIIYSSTSTLRLLLFDFYSSAFSPHPLLHHL